MSGCLLGLPRATGMRWCFTGGTCRGFSLDCGGRAACGPALNDAPFRPNVERKWTLLALDSGLLTWPSARSYGRFSGVQIEQAKVT